MKFMTLTAPTNISPSFKDKGPAQPQGPSSGSGLGVEGGFVVIVPSESLFPNVSGNGEKDNSHSMRSSPFLIVEIDGVATAL